MDLSFFTFSLDFIDSILYYFTPFILTLLFLPIAITLLYSLLWLIRHLILAFIRP